MAHMPTAGEQTSRAHEMSVAAITNDCRQSALEQIYSLVVLEARIPKWVSLG